MTNNVAKQILDDNKKHRGIKNINYEKRKKLLYKK